VINYRIVMEFKEIRFVLRLFIPVILLNLIAIYGDR